MNGFGCNLGNVALPVATSYDEVRRPVSFTFPDSQTVSYHYDGLGQLTAIPGYAENGQYNFAGRLTRIDAANGTGRTKQWDASSGTLDAYQWTGTGKDLRALSWDIRGNLSGQTKDGYSASYLYDAQNRLIHSQEGWPVEVTSKDNPNAR